MKSMQAIVFAVFLALCSTLFARNVVRDDFSSSQLSDKYAVKGDVSVDSSKNNAKSKGGALKVAPGASVTLELSDENSSGRVEFWVYDDKGTPGDPSKRSTGPRWGLSQKDGRIMAVGNIYAPYLDGQNTYMASYFSGGSWFGQISRLKGVGRTKGWHKWSFTMHGTRGLTIKCDDKDVNSQYKNFDWNKTQFLGFTDIVILGDDNKKDGQTIWIDDVFAMASSESRARPAAYQEMVPRTDPKENDPAPITDLMKNNVHPRLLFTQEDIPALKAYAKGAGKVWFDKLNQYAYACVPPKSPEDVKFLKNATDGQRYGFWKMPTIALHYVITGNQGSFDKALGFMKILLELEHWETTNELDSGMSAGNIMIGAGLTYDMLYNDLDPDFREKFREKLVYQARAQYYGGHLMRAPNRVHYWQGDPQNNHRWHRNGGMASCILAAYDGSDDQQWILKRVYDELRFIDKWLPKDGTCHESGSYMIFGGSHLMVGMQGASHCFDYDFLANPFYGNQARFRMHLMTPGLKNVFEYGDSGGTGSYNGYLLKCAIDAGLTDVHDGLLEMAKQLPNAFMWGWQALVWGYEPIGRGDYRKIEKTAFFEDMGILFARDGWDKENVAMMFKCGPYGGYDLNRYSREDNYRYVNVAHDDPDANMILISAGGTLLAENDRYEHHKYTKNHNTILVNGSGQKMEAEGFLQPYGGQGAERDMTKSAVVTGVLQEDGVTIVEGEAAGSYPAIKRGQKWGGKNPDARPALERYRRTAIWVEGEYLLVLDDIKAEKRAEITWMMQSGDMKSLRNNTFRMTKTSQDGESVSRDFQIASLERFRPNIIDSPAGSRGKPMGWRQLQAVANTDRWQLATVFNLWEKRNISVDIRTEDKDTVKVVVKYDGKTDKWTWNEPEGKFVASEIEGDFASGNTVEFNSSYKPEIHGYE